MEISKKRYLLYIDILGFRELIRQQDADEIYKIVDSCLRLSHFFEKLDIKLSTIYFSDTIIIYQSGQMEHANILGQLIILSGIITNELLSNKIPIRGVITFGDFTVAKDSSGRHEIFYGNALIDAYDTEKNENFIGIIVHPSVWEPLESGKYKNKILHEREDGYLLVNPFYLIKDIFLQIRPEPTEIESTLFNSAIDSLNFINNQVNNFENAFDFSSKKAVKYYATFSFAKKILGEECFNWAINQRTHS